MAKVNILVVDDHAESLIALEAALEVLGENIVKAQSGRVALKHLLERDFAVILLDVNMADMNGLETAALIRQRERSQHTPIIFLTGSRIDQSEIFQGYSVGAV